MTRPTRADADGRAYLDLQNLARRQGRPTQALLVMHVLERFLARLVAWQARRATTASVIRDGDLYGGVRHRSPARSCAGDRGWVTARLLSLRQAGGLVRSTAARIRSSPCFPAAGTGFASGRSGPAS